MKLLNRISRDLDGDDFKTFLKGLGYAVIVAAYFVFSNWASL